MKRITTMLKWPVAALLCAASVAPLAGQVAITSAPSAVNDTLQLCAAANSTANYSATGPAFYTYSWDFQGGAPATGFGLGPHVVNYGTPGVFPVFLYIDSLGLPIDTLTRYVLNGAPATVSFNPSDTLFCEQDAPHTLNGGNPAPGYYRGPGVASGQFDPAAAGPGTHTLYYIYKNGGCTDSAQADFTVTPAISADLQALGTPTMFNGKQTYVRCAPANSTFNFHTNNNSATYTSYTIDFGDGSAPQSGTTFPSPLLAHSYGGYGIYKVALTLNNPNGCASTDTVLVYYGTSPNVNFGIKGTSRQCLTGDSTGVTLTFPISNVAGNPPGTIYEVQASDGSPPKFYNHPPPDSVLHTFYEPSCGYNTVYNINAFQVTLTVHAPCPPNPTVNVEPIYISDPPTAAFSVEPRVCFGKVVDINDESWGSLNAMNGCDTNTLLVWEISPSTFTVNSGFLGNLNGSGQSGNWTPGTEHVRVTFNQSGFYTIRQYVGNQAGCEIDTITKVICVDSIPTPDFGTSRDSLCAPDTVEAFYLNNTVSLCDTSTIHWSITPATGWTMIGPDNDSLLRVVFQVPGLYAIQIQTQNVCDTATQTHTVKVQGEPVVTLPADRNYCGLDSFDFAVDGQQPAVFDGLANVSHHWQISPATGWNFQNGTSAASQYPDINFTAFGLYEIIYTASNLCGADSDTMLVRFSRFPELDSIQDTLLCYGTNYSRKLNATSGTPPFQFTWQALPGGPIQNNDSIFLGTSTYSRTIQITVTDSMGCTDQTQFDMNVTAVFLADAGSDQTICGYDTTALRGSAVGGAGGNTFWWSPGQYLSDSTSMNPSVGILPGNTMFTLTVMDSIGCTAVDSLWVRHSNPNVNAGPDFSACLNTPAFTLNNQMPMGGFFTGPGVFGDSIFDPASAGLGAHSLIYEYTDALGCVHYDTVVAHIIDAPLAAFSLSPDSGCSPLSVSVFDSSTVGVSHEWYWGDSLFSTAPNPSFVLINESAVQDSIAVLKLVIRAGSGCADSISKTIKINPAPAVDFNLPPGFCASDTIVPMQNSSYQSGSKFQWTASPGVWLSNDTIAAPQATFPGNQGGFDSTYNFTLVITSPNGCADSLTQSITIFANPIANFSMPAPDCAPIILNPFDSAQGQNLSYQWKVFPNISIQGATHHTPTFDFPKSVSDSVVYVIRQIVTNSNGCQDSIDKNYVVYPTPIANFAIPAADTCGPFSFTFENASFSGQSGMDRSTMTFLWDFGNGQTSTDSVPSVIYTNTGTLDSTFVISLSAENAFGCRDTFVDSITIHPSPQAVFSFANAANCAPFVIDSNVVQAQKLAFANDRYYWEIFDENGILVKQDSGASGISYTLPNPGDSAWIRLTATSPFGCNSDTSLQLFYTILNPAAFFNPLPPVGCSPLTVSAVDSSTPGAAKKWYVNDSLYHIGSNPSFYFVNNGIADSIIDIKLIIEAGSGCKDSTVQQVTVFPNPRAGFEISASGCYGDTIVPNDTSMVNGAPSYKWYVNSSAVFMSNDTVAAPKFVFPKNQSGVDSTYIISMVMTSPNGCRDSVSRSVVIFSAPLADFQIPANSCGSIFLGPIDQSQGNNLQYVWRIQPNVPKTGDFTSAPNFDFPVSMSDSVQYYMKMIVTDSVTGCSDTIEKPFTIYPKPTADFMPSRPDSCGPFTVRFHNFSNPNQSGMNRSSMTFDWDFGNGQTSTDSVPVITFTNSGVVDSIFTVRLIAANFFGCSDTIFDTITVHPDPRADLTSIYNDGCAPFLIDTSIVSHGNLIGTNGTIQWQFLDVNSGSVLANFNRYDSLRFLLPTPGDSVILRMIAFSKFGCGSDTASQLFYSVGRAPIGFTASVDSGCSPLVVSFADTGNGFNTWSWYVNDSLVSQLQNPVLTFTNSNPAQDSVFTVKLVANAGNGCPDSITQTVRVYAPLAPAFSIQNACLGDSLSFINNTPNTDSVAVWFWNFGDGNSDSSSAPGHQYAASGQYVVTLTATSIHGCVFTVSDTAVQYPRPVANFGIDNTCGLDSACFGQPVIFYDSTSVGNLGGNPVQWVWDFDNDSIPDQTGHQPSYTFPAVGIYPVTLIVTTDLGCSDTVTRDIYIYEIPSARFALDSIFECGPFQPTVSDSSTGFIKNYFWSVYGKDGAGQPVIFFTSTSQNPTLPKLPASFEGDTTYFIALTVSNCCGQNTFTDSLQFKSNPVAGLSSSVSSGCTPLNVTFQMDGLVDGDPDYLILNTGSRIDTLHRFYQLKPNGDTTWVWGQHTLTFVNHGLQDTTYNVSLTASNDCGDSTVSLPILVHPNNIQAFINAAPQSGCAPLTVTFIDQSFGGTNTSWCLDYDTATGVCNRPSSVGDTIVHTYTAAGTYTVAQFVDDGCTYDTTYVTIVVHPSPTALFAQSGKICAGGILNFTDQSTADTIAGYAWDFGDGTSSILQNPNHLYQNGGSFVACLTVTSTNGCTSTFCDTVQVYDKPEVNFSGHNACQKDQPIAFFDSTTVQQGQIISTVWKFGDGNTSVAINPQHTYATAGNYTVTLIKESTYGCKDSAQKVINIFPSPTADFQPYFSNSKKCGAPQHYSFNNLSSNAAGYYWDFDYNGKRGDKTTTLLNPTFIFTESGVYDVLLVATNPNGCRDSMMKTVYIRPFPKAGFAGDTLEGCAPLTVNFSDTSTYDFAGPGGITERVWDFGDGNFAYDDSTVTHTYLESGNYTVTLTVQTDGGCADSITYNNYVNVYSTPIADFTDKKINSKTFEFNNLSRNLHESTTYYWDFGDGTFSREKDPTHTFKADLFEKDHQFDVCLITQNKFGCGDTVCNAVYLDGYLLYVPNAFTPDMTGVGEASYFLPKGNSFETYHLFIYDEWGNVIFESQKIDENGIPTEPWDGKHHKNETDLPMGAYVWMIEATYDDGTIWPGLYNDNTEKRQSFGTVTLLR